jgi:arabinose-5-phosphate isomerase
MALNKLINEVKLSETYFWDNFDTFHFENIVNSIIKFKNNNIMFCGVGKSSNIAKHTSDMLKSIGYSSHNLEALNLLHGDFGMIKNNDLIILYSKSGNTKELIDICPYIKKKKCLIIGIFCNKSAELIKFCNEYLILPNFKELDNNFNLIPTTSFLYFTLFNNLLISYLVKKNNLTLEDYGKNHPAGSIGKKINLKINDIMHNYKETSILDVNDNIFNCLFDMSEKRTSCSIITKDKLYYGFISGGDLRKYIKDNIKNLNFNDSIKNIVNSNAIVCYPNDNLFYILKNIKDNDMKFLSGIPVINKEKEVLGFLDNKSIIKKFNIINS